MLVKAFAQYDPVKANTPSPPPLPAINLYDVHASLPNGNNPARSSIASSSDNQQAVLRFDNASWVSLRLLADLKQTRWTRALTLLLI